MGVCHTASTNSIKETVPNDKRGMAFTLFAGGNTVGHFIFPLLFTGLYSEKFLNIETATTLKIIGTTFLVVAAAGMLFTDSDNEQPKLFDVELLARPQYVLYVLHAFVVMRKVRQILP